MSEVRKIRVFLKGTGHESQRLTLDGVSIRLDTYTNKEDGSWYADFYDAEDEPLALTLALAPGLDIVYPYRYKDGIPPGLFWVQTDTGDDPTLDSFQEGTSALYYQDAT